MFRTDSKSLTVILLSTAMLGLAVFPPTAAGRVGVSDGVNAVSTPEGSWVVLPTGWPTNIVLDQGVETRSTLGSTTFFGGTNLGAPGTDACHYYQAGYTSDRNGFNHDFGAEIYVTLQNLPGSLTDPCMGSGDGVGYWTSVLIGGTNGDAIQAGWKAEKKDGGNVARIFCQSFVAGALKDDLESGNTFGAGNSLGFAVIDDSANNWHAYYVTSDHLTHDIGCSVHDGNTNGKPPQFMGEVNAASSTSIRMGPMAMFGLQWLDDSRRWHASASLSARYDLDGTVSYDVALDCPPYGAGRISSGTFSPGTNAVCLIGTFNYPIP